MLFFADWLGSELFSGMHLESLRCFSSRDLPVGYEGTHEWMVCPLVPQAPLLVNLALLCGFHDFGMIDASDIA